MTKSVTFLMNNDDAFIAAVKVIGDLNDLIAKIGVEKARGHEGTPTYQRLEDDRDAAKMRLGYILAGHPIVINDEGDE